VGRCFLTSGQSCEWGWSVAVCVLLGGRGREGGRGRGVISVQKGGEEAESRASLCT
jgi:hypothetical protein